MIAKNRAACQEKRKSFSFISRRHHSSPPRHGVAGNGSRGHPARDVVQAAQGGQNFLPVVWLYAPAYVPGTRAAGALVRSGSHVPARMRLPNERQGRGRPNDSSTARRLQANCLEEYRAVTAEHGHCLNRRKSGAACPRGGQRCSPARFLLYIHTHTHTHIQLTTFPRYFRQ